MKPRLALYQPEIPQSTGTLLRLAACWGFATDIIGPCGFIWSERRLRRSGMDYLANADVNHHVSWQDFLHQSANQRLILLTPHTTQSYLDFEFDVHDTLLVGQESVGVPEDVVQRSHSQVMIPMRADCRSLNVALSAAIVMSEALRQLNKMP